MADKSVKGNSNIILICFILLILVGGYILIKYFGSQEAQNKLGRVAITFLEGDYDVTYTDMQNVKVWHVRDGKVTSNAEKGYYFFWADNKYVQTPIGRTFIEEVKR